MTKIYLLGLGPGDREGLTLGVLEIIEKVTPLFLRTHRHPAVAHLEELGVAYSTFDSLYDQEDDYDVIYAEMARRVLCAAKDTGVAAYALPGHPLIAEKSVRILLETARHEAVETEIRAGGSFMEAVLSALKLDPSGGVTFLNALDLGELREHPSQDVIIFQLHNPRIASQVKLKLMEFFPDDYSVTLVKSGGMPGEEQVIHSKLFELDRLKMDHLTSLYVPRREGGLPRLLKVMEVLRGEGGCPWDREQDYRSLRPYVIEEAYEVVEAVGSGDEEEIVNELGDLLLQVIFYAQIGREKGDFSLSDIINGITEKIIRRHPHVFGNAQVSNVSDVLKTWQEVKETEGGTASCLQDTSRELPALLRAHKLQGKAARLGFDWPDISGAWSKVFEEIEELKRVYNMGVLEKIEDEFGDVIFAMVNVARFLGVNPEVALTQTITKFCNRFAYIEEKVQEGGGNFSKYSLEELDNWWEEAKKNQ